MKRFLILPIGLLLFAMTSHLALAGGDGGAEWTNLTGNGSMELWQGDNQGWIIADEVTLDSSNPLALTTKPGSGVLVSTLEGQVGNRNLSSRQLLGDVEVHLEFLLSQGSNGGVKLQGLYEIQIYDSYGKKNPKADDCGGIYPRAELSPYRTIDKGFPPRTNAAKPAGVWQTLDIIFRAPRFDDQGEKTADARFVKVVLNDQVIHADVELRWPTGYAWSREQEVARGPLFLQGDHGPVAYRNVRVRPVSVP